MFVKVEFENNELVEFFLEEIIKRFDFKEESNNMKKKFFDIEEFDDFVIEINEIKDKYKYELNYKYEISLD